ncbi:MAG: class I tRNA ligase family protein [bacterium]|nr:class I tRNA ligase family protein [bacterium]
MPKYNPKSIEKYWQNVWEKDKLYRAKDKSKKPKYYQLETFPYPSAAGLHVGHPKGYIAEDIHARYMRMNGHEVMYTMGWDAFGLPTENYAIKVSKSPQEVAEANIKNFKRQLQMFGLSYDWDREIDTSSLEYYKWTQWLFIELFKAGLAYRKNAKVNWCPKDQTVLANEQVVDGKCERCGSEVIQKEMEQWFFKITDYADRLLDELKGLDWPEATIKRQADWIGRSEGALIKFSILNSKSSIEVFTTRPDTLFGATYMVLAPEHDLVQILRPQIKNWSEIEKYIEQSKKKTELQRKEEEKDKTGIEMKGIKAVNPATKEEMPIWIADYVLMGYGTGAIMAVPAHDERDFEFAKKFNLPIEEVVVPNIIDQKNPPVQGKKIVERKNIHAIVRDPKTDKYLALKWKKFNWTTFPMGGVEEGENVVDAAMREVREETGFVNLKLKEVITGQVRAEYFAAHKDQNRVALTTAVVFDLVNHEQNDISQEEKDSHEIIWLEKSKLNYEHMTHAEIGHWSKRMGSSFFTYIDRGVLINSGKFDGMDSEKAKWEITKFVGGKRQTQYRLHDWSVSRQRYWGVPIPMLYCKNCGIVPVSERELPIVLPKLEDYRPKGKPPLAGSDDFMNTTCPKCKGEAKRDPETLDTFVDSSWYYLRYTDPNNGRHIFDKNKAEHWMPVDLYVIGAEHTVLHLLYSRFITKFLNDKGFINFNEPFKKIRHVGLIMGEDGQKMSKSRGNVVNPDELVNAVGADTARIYEMFMGPFEDSQPWDTKSIIGVHRFLNRFYNLFKNNLQNTNHKTQADSKSQTANSSLDHVLHKTIKKVGEDIKELRFNTAVSELMKLLNEFEKNSDNLKLKIKNLKLFLVILAPFAPHLTEEIWMNVLGNKKSIHLQKWPEYNPNLVKEKSVDFIIQVNGRFRDSIQLPFDSPQETVMNFVLKSERIKSYVPDQKEIKKVIFVANKLINLVI